MSEELEDLIIIGKTKDKIIFSKNQCKELANYLIDIDKKNKQLKEEIQELHRRDTYTNIVHNQFQIEKKEKRYYKNILDELEKWLKEENKKTFIDIVSITAYWRVLNKIKELKGSDK